MPGCNRGTPPVTLSHSTHLLMPTGIRSGGPIACPCVRAPCRSSPAGRLLPTVRLLVHRLLVLRDCGEEGQGASSVPAPAKQVEQHWDLVLRSDSLYSKEVGEAGVQVLVVVEGRGPGGDCQKVLEGGQSPGTTPLERGLLGHSPCALHQVLSIDTGVGHRGNTRIYTR
jgi:hypothetical protein